MFTVLLMVTLSPNTKCIDGSPRELAACASQLLSFPVTTQPSQTLVAQIADLEEGDIEIADTLVSIIPRQPLVQDSGQVQISIEDPSLNSSITICCSGRLQRGSSLDVVVLNVIPPTDTSSLPSIISLSTTLIVNESLSVRNALF